MCYAIPAKLVEIKDNNIGVVDYYGEHRNVFLDLDDVEVGDYIFAQGGVMVRKVPKEDALEILAAWEEIFFELKKKDEELTQIDEGEMSANILEVLQKVNLKKTIDKNDARTLFRLDDPSELAVMCDVANHVRQRIHGNSCCVHGIIEFSNYCAQNCYYCGIRKDRSLERYRMTVDEIVAAAKNAVDNYGFNAVCLQSGEDFWYDDNKLVDIVREVRALGVLVFISIGSRSIQTYQKLYDAGARAVLLRFETSNKGIFSKLRPKTKLEDRIELIKAVKKIGYILSTGFIVGLPGETEEDIINNLFLTEELKPDMFSFGPLIPTVGTPLESVQITTADLMMKVIAIARFVAPNSNILVTTALETLGEKAKRDGLIAGANSLMIDVTPVEFQDKYQIYDSKTDIHRDTAKTIKDTIDLLTSLGRAPTDLGV